MDLTGGAFPLLGETAQEVAKGARKLDKEGKFGFLRRKGEPFAQKEAFNAGVWNRSGGTKKKTFQIGVMGESLGRSPGGKGGGAGRIPHQGGRTREGFKKKVN